MILFFEPLPGLAQPLKGIFQTKVPLASVLARVIVEVENKVHRKRDI